LPSLFATSVSTHMLLGLLLLATYIPVKKPGPTPRRRISNTNKPVDTSFEAIDRHYGAEMKKKQARTLAKVTSVVFTKRARKAHHALLEKTKTARKQNGNLKAIETNTAVSKNIEHTTAIAQLTAVAAKLGLGNNVVSAIAAAASAKGTNSIWATSSTRTIPVASAATALAIDAAAGTRPPPAKAPQLPSKAGDKRKLRKNSHRRYLKVAGTHGRRGFNVFTYLRKVDSQFSRSHAKALKVRSYCLARLYTNV
jgi:hypothetical protein